MIKKACSYFSIFILYMAVNGCGAAQLAIGAAEIATHLASSNSSNSYISLGVYEYRKYKVKVFNHNSRTDFHAFNNIGREVKFISLNDNNFSNDIKTVNDFKMMDETKKKKFIKDLFIEMSNFDLDPIESQTLEVEKSKETSSLPSYSATK